MDLGVAEAFGSIRGPRCDDTFTFAQAHAFPDARSKGDVVGRPGILELVEHRELPAAISRVQTPSKHGLPAFEETEEGAARIFLILQWVIRTRKGLLERTLIQTYLGSDAAERVLAGNIVRGRAEPIRAVVWFSDLVGYTRISDTSSPGTVLELLNDYAEAQVEEIEAQGGHVLKFIGDGILAIFPQEEMAQACARALDAATNLTSRIATLNVRRAAHGMPVTSAHIALHVGELLYGNLGSPRRLDFTVLGPAVNEAARIESFCASLEQAVIVSTTFAEASGQARGRLVSVGRYAMKGIARPQELFTLDVAHTLAES